MAQVLALNLSQEQRAFSAFLTGAHYADCGRSAAERCLELPLGDAAAMFLGEGDWEPGAEDGRRHRSYAESLVDEGRYEEALADCAAALEIDPGRSEARITRSYVYIKSARFDEAVAELERILEREPVEPTALNNLAWILATAPHAPIRDGARALTLVRRAIEVETVPRWYLQGTLAAACAECGDFAGARQAAEQAWDLASASDRALLLDQRASYDADRPHRDDSTEPPA